MEWLSNPRHYESMSTQELQVLLSEVQNSEIGIYGLDLFKFTSGLLGSVRILPTGESQRAQRVWITIFTRG